MWIDVGATRHIYSDKNMFTSYKLEGENMNLYMRNSSAAKVITRGSIKLHFTSGKTILVREVLHIRDVRQNLVSDALLSKYGLRWSLSQTNLF